MFSVLFKTNLSLYVSFLGQAMTSELTKAFEDRLTKQSGSNPPTDEKKPSSAKPSSAKLSSTKPSSVKPSSAKPSIKPSSKPSPNRKPSFLKSDLAKELNISLAQKDHKPRPLTSKPKVSTKSNQSQSKVNGGGPPSKDSPGAAALANLLQTSDLRKSPLTEKKTRPHSEAPADPETPAEQPILRSSNKSKSPKPILTAKSLSVSEFSKPRSSSDITRRPFNDDASKVFDKEFMDERPRQRSSPVVTPSGSPFLAANRKNRSMTSTSGCQEVSVALSRQETSVCEADHNDSPSVPHQASKSKLSQLNKTTSLPCNTVVSLSLEKESEKVISGSENSSLLIDNVQATSGLDSPKAINSGVKKKPVPPPASSKPGIRGPRPQLQPKPPTMAGLKGEAMFSKRQSSVSGSRETSPDSVSSSQETTGTRKSLDSDSLEDTLKVSSSTQYSDVNEIEDTLKNEIQDNDDWVLVDKNKAPPVSESMTPPSPLKIKKQSSTSSLTESPQKNICVKPIPPIPLSKSVSPQAFEISPKVSEKVSKDGPFSSSPNSPAIVITRTMSDSVPPGKRRSTSESSGVCREKIDSGLGSEVPDDLGLARGQSVDSLPNSPLAQTTKDTEVWDEARVRFIFQVCILSHLPCIGLI